MFCLLSKFHMPRSIRLPIKRILKLPDAKLKVLLQMVSDDFYNLLLLLLFLNPMLTEPAKFPLLGVFADYLKNGSTDLHQTL